MCMGCSQGNFGPWVLGRSRMEPVGCRDVQGRWAGPQRLRGMLRKVRGFETSADARRVRKRPLATWLPPRAGSNVTGTLNVNVWALSRWGYWVVCRAVVAGRCRQWTACLQFPLPLNLQKKQSRPSSKPVAGGGVLKCRPWFSLYRPNHRHDRTSFPLAWSRT